MSRMASSLAAAVAIGSAGLGLMGCTSSHPVAYDKGGYAVKSEVDLLREQIQRLERDIREAKSKGMIGDMASATPAPAPPETPVAANAAPAESVAPAKPAFDETPLRLLMEDYVAVKKKLCDLREGQEKLAKDMAALEKEVNGFDLKERELVSKLGGVGFFKTRRGKRLLAEAKEKLGLGGIECPSAAVIPASTPAPAVETAEKAPVVEPAPKVEKVEPVVKPVEPKKVEKAAKLEQAAKPAPIELKPIVPVAPVAAPVLTAVVPPPPAMPAAPVPAPEPEIKAPAEPTAADKLAQTLHDIEEEIARLRSLHNQK
ncbi:MAG: hypothetical protein HYZ53_09545 [Planctomycetes bacterium]|nr:hypothetical protein [Planctomycetota bacterium]